MALIWVSRSMPSVESATPTEQSCALSEALTEHLALVCDARTDDRHRQEAEAGLRAGRRARTSCMNWVRKKNMPVMPATSSSRAEVGATAAAVGEQARAA